MPTTRRPSDILLDETSPVRRVFGEDFNVRRGVNLGPARSIAREVFGDPGGLSGTETNRMQELQTRASRLGPMQPTAGGSAAIPGNPYSVDTRNLITGATTAAAGLINKERFDRIYGNEGRVIDNRARSENLERRANNILEEGRTGVRGAIDNARATSLLRRSNRAQERSNRYGGFASELTDLRTRAATETERANQEREFMVEQAKEELKSSRAVAEKTVNEMISADLQASRESILQGMRDTASMERLNRRYDRMESMEKQKREFESENNIDARKSAQIDSLVLRSLGFNNESLNLREKSINELYASQVYQRMAEDQNKAGVGPEVTAQDLYEKDLEDIAKKRREIAVAQLEYVRDSGWASNEAVDRQIQRIRGDSDEPTDVSTLFD